MVEIINSTTFRKALQEKLFAEALEWFLWLVEDSDAKERYGDEWERVSDDRGRELYRELRDSGNYKLAKILVERTPNENSRAGRMRNLADTARIGFDKI